MKSTSAVSKTLDATVPIMSQCVLVAVLLSVVTA